MIKTFQKKEVKDFEDKMVSKQKFVLFGMDL